MTNKAPFSKFLSSHTEQCLYFLFVVPFWFVQLVVVKRNICVCFCRKTASCNHSSDAFDSSGCIWLRPDKTWAYMESDSVELVVHTELCHGCAWMDLAWWRIPSLLWPPSSTSVKIPTVVLWEPELTEKGEGCVGPQATDVALHKGQREETLSQMNRPEQTKFRQKL